MIPNPNVIVSYATTQTCNKSKVHYTKSIDDSLILLKVYAYSQILGPSNVIIVSQDKYKDYRGLIGIGSHISHRLILETNLYSQSTHTYASKSFYQHEIDPNSFKIPAIYFENLLNQVEIFYPLDLKEKLNIVNEIAQVY